MAISQRTAEDRFWSKVNKTDSCWLWTGAITGHGYGNFYLKGRYIHAHRFLLGSVPAGLHVDHLCRTKRCVNPAHLEPVTPAVNLARGIGKSQLLHQAGVCANGHDVTGDNGYRRGGKVQCRACNAAWAKDRRSKNREKYNSYMADYQRKRRAAK